MIEEPQSVLDPVRQLEGALEAAAATRAASEMRLEEARSTASDLLAAARHNADAVAAERRRVAIAAVEDDVAEISRQGAATVALIRTDSRASCAAVIEAALALILRDVGDSEV